MFALDPRPQVHPEHTAVIVSHHQSNPLSHSTHIPWMPPMCQAPVHVWGIQPWTCFLSLWTYVLTADSTIQLHGISDGEKCTKGKSSQLRMVGRVRVLDVSGSVSGEIWASWRLYRDWKHSDWGSQTHSVHGRKERVLPIFASPASSRTWDRKCSLNVYWIKGFLSEQTHSYNLNVSCGKGASWQSQGPHRRKRPTDFKAEASTEGQPEAQFQRGQPRFPVSIR